MKTEFKGKHFITLQDWNKEELDTLLDVSFDLKRKYAMGLDTPYLLRKTMFLMFFEQSTRTRNSMEAGIAQLGGHANFLDTSTMQISHGESAPCRYPMGNQQRIRQLFFQDMVMPLHAGTVTGKLGTNISEAWQNMQRFPL